MGLIERFIAIQNSTTSHKTLLLCGLVQPVVRERPGDAGRVTPAREVAGRER